MKYLLLGILAFLLLLSQTTQAQEWEVLSSSEVKEGESRVPRDLLDVAVGYVLQKGRFESTKTPFPGDFYWEDRDNVKYERRTTSTLTYYRFNFLLAEDNGGPSAVNATVTISYNPSNWNFIVTDYHYNIDYSGNEYENQEITEVVWDTENELIDTRTLTGDGDLAQLVRKSFDKYISQQVSGYNLPEANYTIIRVYRANIEEFDGVEEVNEEGELNEETEDDGGVWPSQGYRYYDFFIKFKSSERKYYLMRLNIDYVKDKETGEFGPEVFATNGSMKLDWYEPVDAEYEENLS